MSFFSPARVVWSCGSTRCFQFSTTAVQQQYCHTHTQPRDTLLSTAEQTRQHHRCTTTVTCDLLGVNRSSTHTAANFNLNMEQRTWYMRHGYSSRYCKLSPPPLSSLSAHRLPLAHTIRTHGPSRSRQRWSYPIVSIRCGFVCGQRHGMTASLTPVPYILHLHLRRSTQISRLQSNLRRSLGTLIVHTF